MMESFVEICIYEVKPEKTDEFEELPKEVSKHHKGFKGTMEAKWMKRTHRQKDSNSGKKRRTCNSSYKKAQKYNLCIVSGTD